ncbi:uncharacterized protein PHACADRAFT_259072 [Phanerochaete carnosa HHB-10118-sp]|uniref:Methyltransferase domain-containing protein n=1 Tax=Phanerochaete carnosa (strain HHB-10118-sp) TaxID=650164 RepID=K5UXT8_PHACS|nr:uncharacterized protein PHACADRAFT_259072 [Phanerochaete carnosa HHB-10118-sp]EKM54906.1 hypothetical protein PHACADRAFT_259072 [Phanerochaete carnosa HHB-10118-sp]
MSVLTRHPRYCLLLICVLLGAFFMLSTPSFPAGSLRPGSSISKVLADEDRLYDEALKARQELVEKWGPTDEDVASFPEPQTGYFYTLWDFFLPVFRCPHLVQRVGTLGDGGKWVCGLDRIARQSKPCTIYSFGINGESSFEAALLEAAPHCEVWGYDFSVTSFGPEIANVSALDARGHFFSYALSGDDAPHATPPRFTLQSLMQQNGHDFIDILKVDIESWEFESLDAFVDAFIPSPSYEAHHPHAAPAELPVLPVGQLQLEIHAWGQNGEFKRFRKWWERLENAGLRPFWTEPNLVYINLVRGSKPDLAEYSFMNIRGNHALVSDRY